MRGDIGIGTALLWWLFAVIFVGFWLATANVTSVCLKAGYPSSRIDYAFNAYCIKRVDQSDVVVSFSEIKK